MSFTRESLRRKLAGLAELAGTPGRLIVAFSGGLDSTVLLHALATGAKVADESLLAVHVNHGLNENSNDWLRSCESVAGELGVPFESMDAIVDRSDGQGLEAAARHARYGVLRRFVTDSDWLLSAHHRDDQAETLLLNLMRGSGPAGLAGIGEVQPVAEGWLVRPLLDYSRRDLLEYAERFGLTWIDDPSNEDRSFDRNYLRHEILPRLDERWPKASTRLRRSAVLASEAATMLDQLAELDRQNLGERPDVLSLTGLLALPGERQRNLLRYVVRELGLPSPPAAVLTSVVNELVLASEDAQPLVQWAGAEVRRYRDRVYVLAARDDGFSPEPQEIRSGRADLGPDLGRLELRPGAAKGLSDAVVNSGLTVRYREGGEKLKIDNQIYTKKLKSLLQEEGVVPWMRERLPLIYSGDQLVAVGDLWIASDAFSTPGVGIRWSERPALH